ncbi:MAG: Gfo/Idh/MocA family oxidoreductase [Clostridia bacterium]|nr:Gfo/Idh/MocA family oxidoreductase [Clostridia bacterium]
MKKIRIGVFGVYRGTSMIRYCKSCDTAEVVAMCDKWEEGLERQKEHNKDLDITYYTSFDEFIKHDMDAVVLANYANEHAPFAIKALKAGKHVISEVLPCQTMKEAVELIEAVEESGLVYSYAENYCYMSGVYEMKRLYEEGKIGEIEYAEGEYIHNCDAICHCLSYGDPDHWRNNLYSTFYCTHSFGPIRHITGLRPVSVVGLESLRKPERKKTIGKGAGFGVEMVTLENGTIVRSVHGSLYKDSIWYCLYGTRGRMETARAEADEARYNHLYVNYDEYSGAYDTTYRENYRADERLEGAAAKAGHGGSDFFTMDNFIRRINGDTSADIIDVYEALDMSLVGMFAFRSILAGGVTVEIPNLRNKEEREKWRNDTACTDPKVAGDMLLPCRKGGNPVIDPVLVERDKMLWEAELASRQGYSNDAFSQPEANKHNQ